MFLLYAIAAQWSSGAATCTERGHTYQVEFKPSRVSTRCSLIGPVQTRTASISVSDFFSAARLGELARSWRRTVSSLPSMSVQVLPSRG